MSQHPQWGQPPQQYPQQPGWGAPPPPRKPPMSTGKIVGFSILGIVGALLVFGILGAMVSDSGASGGTGNSVSASKETEAEKDNAPAVEDESAPEAEPTPENPVKIVAKKTTFAPTVLADGSNYTSIKLTVTNNSEETIHVNPLFFEITDSKGTKYDAELAADNNQIDAVDLAPGENVSGTITGKGKFTPKFVTYKQFIGDPVRVPVS